MTKSQAKSKSEDHNAISWSQTCEGGTLFEWKRSEEQLFSSMRKGGKSYVFT